MAEQMTLRERVRKALKGEMPDQVPFTCYAGLAPKGAEGKKLREMGLAIFERAGSYRVRRPHVKIESVEIAEGRYPGKRIAYKTPVGELTQKQIVEPGYGSSWIKEYLIKRPEDYAVFAFIIRDEIYEPDIDGFLAKDSALGEYGIAVPRAADPPVQELWRRYSGLERFSLDWYDCRTEVQRVLDAMTKRNRRIWEIVANTPSDFCASGGNISGDMIGPPMFDELIMPHFEAEAEIMHKSGKRTLNHMDGMLKSLVETIARCPVDVIEAFNPTPDGNVSVAEAREAWPKKAISINFPSSVHIGSLDYVREMTIDLLRQAGPGNGFVVGITENVPAHVLVASFTTIAETLNEFGRCPINPDALPR